MIGLKRGIVELVPYNEKWPEEFQKEAKILKHILADRAVAIEHIGSTAIPGIKAKPVIDVAVGLRSMEGIESIIDILDKNQYYYRPKFGNKETHVVFAKGDDVSRTHYIHIMRFNGQPWKEKIFFRDYMRSNSQAAQQYEALKLKAANANPLDRKAYTSEKDEFLQTILASMQFENQQQKGNE